MIGEKEKQDTSEPNPLDSASVQKRAKIEDVQSGEEHHDTAEHVQSILTIGERRVLLWCGNGKTSFEISRILGLSEHTVNHYIASAVRKLDAANRTHAIAKALKMNIVNIS
ncbi:MAG: helix-turn-helix transcriptional regulator, partial [Pseudomonadota bacterium]